MLEGGAYRRDGAQPREGFVKLGSLLQPASSLQLQHMILSGRVK